MAGYETPKSVVFPADLPETVGGKVLKYKLRAPSTPVATVTSNRKTEPF